MECQEFRVDMRERTDEDMIKWKRQNELLFKLSHTLPMTEEYNKVL